MEIYPSDQPACGHEECRPFATCRRPTMRIGLDAQTAREIRTQHHPTITTSDRPVYVTPRPDLEIQVPLTSVVVGFARRGVLVDGEKTAPVWECDRCGALVPEDSRRKHRGWHS